VEEAPKNQQFRRLAFKISAIYAFVAALYIFFFSRVAALFSTTPQDLAQIETIKGWLFVLLTALLLYSLVSRGFKRLEASQESYRMGEEKYRALVETTETGYAILDLQGKVLDANMRYVNLTGHNSLHEILGRSVTEWTAAYDVEKVTEEIAKCAEMCFTRHLRVDYAGKSGRIIPIEMNSTLVHSAEGTVILALCEDISERGQAEEALKESEMRFRTIFEHTGVGVAQVESHTGRFVRINRKFCDIVGYSPEELLERDFTSITHPDDREISLRNTARLRAGEVDSYSLEKRYIHKNGTIVWVNLTVSPLWTAGEEREFHVAAVEDITERKRAEDALRESEMRFRTIFELTGVGMAQVESHTGRFVRINNKFCDIVGYSPEEMLCRDYMSLTHPDDLEPCLIELARLTAGEVGCVTMEKRYIHRNGTIMWVNITVSAMGEEREFHVGVVQDITERKRVEEALQQSKAQISHLNDVLRTIRDVGSLIHRAKDPIELLNAVCDSLVQTLGYVMVWIGKHDAGSELLLPVAHSGGGMDFLQSAPITLDDSPTGQGPAGTAIRERRAVIFGDIATDPRFAPWKDPVMAHGAASIASVPLIHEERLFGVLTVKADRPHAFDEEEVRLLCKLAADLAFMLQNMENEDARKRTEEALRASEEKFRLTFLTSPDSINLNRLHDGMYLDINEGFTTITGYTREEAIGKTSLGLNVWDDPKDRQRMVATLEREGFVQNMQAKFRGKDGRFIIGLMSARVLRIDGEDVILTITRDITERERIMEEKGKLEAQLFQAQKMESVGRLAGGVAHDFNNMLGVIIGRAEMALREAVPSDKLHHNLKEIYKAGLRSADLVRQLLAFARKQTAVPQVLDLNGTISGMLKMLKGLIGEDIDLLLLPKLDLWKVKIDPSQVDQILANLVVNARDALTGAGAITVRTENVVVDDSARAETPGLIPGQYVLLTVSDTGAGMSQEVREQIFEPFFTTKEPGKGTGLGLSTVYGIVKQNGGFIYVDSQPGKGTTLKIYLPRFESEPAQR
jgi:PAS domain S-box-containing protein